MLVGQTPFLCYKWVKKGSIIIITRYFSGQLNEWHKNKQRKPLIIRGMRQVGKTFTVRAFAVENSLDLHEINFERNIELSTIFESNNIPKILSEIQSFTGKKVTANSLIFLDEVQSVPEVLESLRYFFEERPELTIIATGSLLDFALDGKKRVSIPVGRVQYAYMWPLTFKEFLLAQKKEYLVTLLDQWDESNKSNKSDDSKKILHYDSFPNMAHQQFMEELKNYFFVGGMPEVVANFVEHKDAQQVIDIQNDLLQSIHDDFGKYAGGKDLALMQRIFKSLPAQIGKKIKYSNITRDEKSATVKNIINLFIKARIIHPIYHSDANGIPLDAQIDPSRYKIIFGDIGLFSRMLGLTHPPSKTVIEGPLAEQFVGQQLKSRFTRQEQEIFYWIRESKSGNAELDFLIQDDTNIIPIEVKSGKSGTLRSLHQFVHDKKVTKAIRFDQKTPSVQDVNVKIKAFATDISQVSYHLQSLPLYLA